MLIEFVSVFVLIVGLSIFLNPLSEGFKKQGMREIRMHNLIYNYFMFEKCEKGCSESEIKIDSYSIHIKKPSKGLLDEDDAKKEDKVLDKVLKELESLSEEKP